MTITLYAHRLSQPSRAVDILLRELGIEHTFHEVDFAGGETHTDWFTHINALQTIPALWVDNHGTPLYLGESHAIMRYLCRTAADQEGAQRWYPGDADPARSARIDQWLDWHHGNVRRYDMFHHLMNLHQTLPMLKREIQSTLLTPLQDGLTPGLAMLEAHLSRQQQGTPALAGDGHPTLADLAISCELHQIMAVGYRFKNYPHVKAWLEAMAERPHAHAVGDRIRAQGHEIREQNSDYLALDAFG
ncbi:glutathione S-transferase family protein [Larsenimonas rhizosphaerae]|uniref:Glutathione S-transferase family protein n=1 Tax=Larsenimonas rhizosphaerae TaxID=2944682 RepID=A0AA42CV67_9GAMM|nr:glutathione S-transferase family protein [Larsenimonas rhizosphaerae]MCX2525382.1 glutathione S-transferase family protein [Larsenimonas rhizosphaerae]